MYYRLDDEPLAILTVDGLFLESVGESFGVDKQLFVALDAQIAEMSQTSRLSPR